MYTFISLNLCNDGVTFIFFSNFLDKKQTDQIILKHKSDVNKMLAQ